MKKTKVVASIGQNNNSNELILEMIEKGVDVFRIDLSEISLKDASVYIKRIRDVSKKINKIIGILLDIDGPGIRIDKLMDDNTFLPFDKEIRIYDYHVASNDNQLSTNCDNLSSYVKLDDVISFGYGDVKIKVIDINNDNFIAKVIDEGYIRSNQNIHIGNIYSKLPFISLKDKENILFAIENNVDFLALSYVRDEQDVLEVVDMLIENGNDHMLVLSKIETKEGFENLNEIIKVSDGLIVARGDLGVNTKFEKLPYYQKAILKKANEFGKIGLVSTDLLKSMIIEKTPSRAEISDIYNAIFDKSDALILNEETMLSNNPVLVIESLVKIIEEAEKNFPYQENLEQTFKQGKLDVTSTIAYSVVDSGILLNVNCILANTMSGYTARKISYFRPKSPILGLSPNKNTVKSLTLNYGVIPVLVKTFKDTDEITKECINKYKSVMDYKIGDTVIITGGMPLNNKNTDFMKIEKIVE